MMALIFLGAYTLGILMAFKKPIFGLYTYILAFYFNPVGVWWGSSLPGLRWSFIAAIITIFAILVSSKNDANSDQANPSAFNKALVLFFVWIAIQNLWALSYPIHSEFTIVCLKFIIAYWIILKTVNTEKDIIGFIAVNAVGAGYLGWYAEGLNRGGRLENIGPPSLHDANFLGLHVAAILIIASFILLLKIDKKKFLIVPFVILILMLIVLTQSRGAMAGIAVAGIYVLFNMPKQIRKQIFCYGILGLVAVGIAMDESFWKRLTGTANAESAEDLDGSAYSRIVIVQAQMDMFVTNPIVGYGHRGTMILSPDYIDEQYMTSSGGSRVRASHNTYMSVAVEHGIIGVFIYLWLIIGAISRSRSSMRILIKHNPDDSVARISLGVGAAFIAVLTSNLFVDGLRLEILVWLIALIDICKNKAKASQEN